jgi:hypothetical protein
MNKATLIEEVKAKALEVRYCTLEGVEGVDWDGLWDVYGELSPDAAARKAHQDRGGTPGISVDH